MGRCTGGVGSGVVEARVKGVGSGEEISSWKTGRRVRWVGRWEVVVGGVEGPGREVGRCRLGHGIRTVTPRCVLVSINRTETGSQTRRVPQRLVGPPRNPQGETVSLHGLRLV